jgi:hypothetical protein
MSAGNTLYQYEDLHGKANIRLLRIFLDHEDTLTHAHLIQVSLDDNATYLAYHMYGGILQLSTIYISMIPLSQSDQISSMHYNGLESRVPSAEG